MRNRNRICIIGIDRFARKNTYQTDWLTQHGFEVDVFATDKQMDSVSQTQIVRFFRLDPRPWARVGQVAKYLLQNCASIHHIEAYIAGRFAIMYIIFARALSIKVLVVERGDLLYYQRREYGWMTRLSMYLSYKLATAVWYKDLYMKSLLDSIGIKRKFLLSNAVPVHDSVDVPKGSRDIDFLWVNRLISIRHPDWFAKNILKLAKQFSFTVEILGFFGETASPDQAKVESEIRNLLEACEFVSLRNYCAPTPFYRRAKFFVLPADLVYCNYALLEAMSYGVVPIVSNVEGSDHIVTDGVNGFVVEHSPEGLLRGMEKALRLDKSGWQTMSQEAYHSIREKFAIDTWGKRLLTAYQQLEKE